MEKSVKLSIVIIIIVLIAATAIFYLSESTQSTSHIPPQPSVQPTSTHHFQVSVNDTFAIAEKHG